MNKIGERIAAVIKSLSIKKTEFAKRLNSSQPYVSELCVGKTRPSDRTIYDICREFKVNEKWLRTGEGEMFLKPTKDEELRDFVDDILESESTDFRRRLISALAKLDTEKWKVLEEIASTLSNETKESDP